MRAKLNALYYPDFWVEYKTLIKCILLFDEIHFMDRPAFMFGGQFGMVGADSPLRQFEKSFRDSGIPLYVHPAPGGPVHGEFLEAIEADLSDANFMARFQDGLRASPHFRNHHIQPGNYGNGETHESIFQKLAAINLQESPSALEIFNDSRVRHLDPTTPEGCLKILAADAACCSAKMTFALNVGIQNGFSPLADASPYSNLLSAKYRRAIDSSDSVGLPIPSTDLSLAILDELVPEDLLNGMQVIDAVKYRKESESSRDAFLGHLLTLQARLGEIPRDGNYSALIEKIIATDIRPAVTEFRNKLLTIREKLFGKIATGALGWAGTSGVVQVFGDITWQKLLSLACAAGVYIAAEAVNSAVEKRASKRDCAISYLLDLETKGQ